MVEDNVVQANVNNYFFKTREDYENHKNEIVNNSTIYIESDATGYEGLPLGFIFLSALPQLNTNYHLLNGDSLTITTYSDFYNLLTTLIAQSWNLTCTANEYAEDIAKTGNCGKFVINSTSSDITGTYGTTTITVSANSFKLPTITRFIQGLSSLSNLGESVEAGLPNITGTFGINTRYNATDMANRTSGAFTFTNQSIPAQYTSGGDVGGYVSFDAARTSSIYGNSNTVQPQSTQYPYYIVVKNNNVSGLMNYLNQGGVSSLGNAVGNITLENGISVNNNELKLVADSITTDITRTNQHDTVIETYISSDGLTWYRKWVSGWKECGGVIASGSNGNLTITLPLEFSDTNYSICYAGTIDEVTSTNTPNYKSFMAMPVTTQTCTVYRWTVRRKYYAFGY